MYRRLFGWSRIYQLLWKANEQSSLSLFFSFGEYKYVIEGCFFEWPPPSKAPAHPRRKIFRWTPGLMASDFKQWQKDSPYGRLVGRMPRHAAARIEQSCLESQRCFGEPKAHLFGVCCIIRTSRTGHTGELIVYPFFFLLLFPIRGKQVLEIYRTALCRPAESESRTRFFGWETFPQIPESPRKDTCSNRREEWDKKGREFISHMFRAR